MYLWHNFLGLSLVFTFSSLIYGDNSVPTSQEGSVIKEIEERITDKTSAKLIALNLKARGGIENMNKLDSIKIVSTRKEAQQDFEEILLIQKPAKIHKTIHRTHLGWDYRTIEIFNGREGWTQELKPEKRNPSEIKKLPLELLIFESELHGAFYNYEKKGHVFSYRGETKFNNSKAYLIRGELKYGLSVDYILDKKTFQIINYRMPDLFAGKQMQVDRIPLGLRKVNGIWTETGYDYKINGKIYRRILIKEIIPNYDIPKSNFTKPISREIWLKGR